MSGDEEYREHVRRAFLERFPQQGTEADVREGLDLLIHDRVPLHVATVGLVLTSGIGGWRWLALRLGLWIIRKAGHLIIKPSGHP